METTKKEFDCIAMKRKGSLHIYEATKDLSFDEKVLYWKERSDEMLRALEKARKAKKLKRKSESAP